MRSKPARSRCHIAQIHPFRLHDGKNIATGRNPVREQPLGQVNGLGGFDSPLRVCATRSRVEQKCMATLRRIQDWVSKTRIRLYTVLLLLFLLPLLSFLYSADRVLRDYTRKRTADQLQQATRLIGRMVEGKLQNPAEQLRLIGARKAILDAWLRGDAAAMDRALQLAHSVQTAFPSLSAHQLDGTLIAVYPRQAAPVHSQFDLRQRYSSLKTIPPVFFSEILDPSSAPVVMIAVVIQGASGRPLGVLMAPHSLQAMKQAVTELGPSVVQAVSIVDQNGTLLPLESPTVPASRQQRGREALRRAQAGQKGQQVFQRGGEDVLTGYAPVGATGWSVIVEVPVRLQNEAIWKLERSVVAAAVVFLLLALGGGLLVATLYRRLRDSEAQTRLIIDRAHDAFVAMDASGIIVDWNPQAATTFGWSREEALGLPLETTLIPAQFREQHRRGLQQFLQSGEGPLLNRRLQVTALHRDGHEFPVELSISPVRAGRSWLFHSFIHDITERKAYEEKIEQQNRELELRNREVERATQLKSQFLASMSHELRTPLNAILGFSELLEEAAGQQSSREQRWVQHIRTAGRHLLQLINDILDLAKIESGRVEIETEDFAVAPAVAEVLSIVQPLATAKHLHLDTVVPQDLFVHADRVRFKQVIYNLLSNAVKFTPDLGSVRVDCAATADAVTVSVSDTGIGIRPEDQEAIFEEFRQAGTNVDGVKEGTGLGLAIARRLLELQGGKIWVESDAGRGSRFTISLPRAGPRQSPQPELPAMPAESHLCRPLVLVVDDDVPTLELLKNILETESYGVLTARSCDTAIELARLHHPDVITLDILLPGNSGWEVLYEIRADAATSGIPVIMLSVVDRKQLGQILGASDYLVKPVSREALLAAIRRHVAPNANSGPILVVDDEPEDLRNMIQVLQSAGYSPVPARNGREALQTIERVRPRAVILDLLMPDVDGFEALRRLRDNPETRNIPVLVITAKELTQAEIELVLRCATAWMRKAPGWRLQVLEQVRNAIAQTQTRTVGTSS